MTQITPQHLRDQIVVLGTPEMVDILYEERGRAGFKDRDIGAIIHLVYHDIDAPGAQPLPMLEIPQELRDLPKMRSYAHIRHHFSELFYGALNFKDIASPETIEKMMAHKAGGMEKAMQIGALLEIKRDDLQRALTFASTYLSTQKDDKKLFIYVACGNKWAPLVALGIIADHLGIGREREAVGILRDVCPFERPELLAGQLAFLDHAMGRGGKLIDAWATHPLHAQFDAQAARNYQKIFETACSYLGPYRPQDKLRARLSAYNPFDANSCG